MMEVSFIHGFFRSIRTGGETGQDILWIHPLVGAAALVYQTAFLSRQAKITRWQSFALVLPAWLAYFAFRILFFM